MEIKLKKLQEIRKQKRRIPKDILFKENKKILYYITLKLIVKHPFKITKI